MIKGMSPRNAIPLRQLLRRIDRIAGELNVVLMVIALGLATLDVTFLVTKKVVDSLPPVTRMAPDATPPASSR